METINLQQLYEGALELGADARQLMERQGFHGRWFRSPAAPANDRGVQLPLPYPPEPPEVTP
jgi:hypothetical protein